VAYVSLTPHLEEFIRREVKSGRHSSPSEVILEAARRLEEKKQLHRDIIEERARAVRGGRACLDFTVATCIIVP
jgi:putative addiction module CopG family antidote